MFLCDCVTASRVSGGNVGQASLLLPWSGGRPLGHVLASVASALLFVLISATVLSAQGAATGERPLLTMSVLGVASVHPVDDTYVGGPYLDRGLGGVGPGAALMVEFVAPTGPTVSQ